MEHRKKIVLSEAGWNFFKNIGDKVNGVHNASNYSGEKYNPTHPMQQSVNNGGRDPLHNEYFCINNPNSFYAQLQQTAKRGGCDYTMVLSELQEKVLYYLNNGYFGQNQDVTNTVKLFVDLLSYLHGAYESAVQRYMNKANGPQTMVAEAWLDNLRYKGQNSYGVNQKIRDNSGSQYAINQRNGQWMTDLQNELRKFLELRYLHGKKTVEATNAFISFLNVEQRKFFVLWNRMTNKASQNLNPQQSLNAMKRALIGVTLLIGTAGMFNSGGGQAQTNNGGIDQPQRMEINQNQQQAQTIQVGFQVNGSEISPQFLQQLQNVGGGKIKIIVHESENPSGRDASYENQLVQDRANAIQQAIGQQCEVERGENAPIGHPYAEVVFNGGGGSTYVMEKMVDRVVRDVLNEMYHRK